ncbi:MAG: hypothetical protein IIA45_02175 [Bacteroidetes bacterium]|nr:hypothetical protein [Bacteroidota bacterium]
MSKPKTDSSPAQQAKNPGRNGNAPPEEHQFQPGQSGNPKGSPKGRTNLWKFICTYMAMTDAELAKVDWLMLTQAKKVALTLVERATKGKGCDSERLARYCVDRDEGKASEHLIIDKDNDLSDDECEEIRTVLRKAYDNAG